MPKDAPLPNRIVVPQDLQDIFDHFEKEANDYVQARMPETIDPRTYRRAFHDERSPRWATDRDIASMPAVIGYEITPYTLGNDSYLGAALGVARDCKRNIVAAYGELGVPHPAKLEHEQYNGGDLAHKIVKALTFADAIRNAIASLWTGKKDTP